MKATTSVFEHNQAAWDHFVATGNKWTVPFETERVAAARAGDVRVVLTPQRRVPDAWFQPLAGKRLLGLACGGGQQSPLFAAAGAQVTVLDASAGQLGQDRLVAQREGLDLSTVQGDMAAMPFEDASFDVIFNPVSTCFVPDVVAVYREVARVLRPGGVFMTGFANPILYTLDFEKAEAGVCQLHYTLPYSDRESLSDEEHARFCDGPVEFSHSLEELIGGQLSAGLVITDLFEDYGTDPLSRFAPAFIATRAVRSAP